jgi:hypothetical protein
MSNKKIAIFAVGATLIALPVFIFAANINATPISNPGQHGLMTVGRGMFLGGPERHATSTIPMPPKDGNETLTVPVAINKVEISGNGETLIIGTVVSIGSGSMTVGSWGGIWNINIVTSTKFMPAGNTVADIKTGDAVEVQGVASKTANWTIDANIVRDTTDQTKNVNATAHPAVLNQRQIQKLQEQYRQLMEKLQQLIQAKNQLDQGKR